MQAAGPAASTLRRGRLTLASAALALGALGSLGSADVRAAGPSGQAAPPSLPAPDARTPAQWLQAIQRAAERVNYTGTVMYQQGTEMRASRVTHQFDGTASHERVQTLDGKPREFLRKRSGADDEVQCLYPETRRIVVERRSGGAAFPSLGAVAPAQLLAQYDVRSVGIDRVAGLETQVLELRPRDGQRWAYRVWADRASGLLLRAQTLNERGDVLEQVAFTDVRVNEKADRSRLKPAWSTTGWAVVRSDYQPVDLAARGWLVPAPPGFRALREVVRPMGEPPDLPHDTLQAVFSDGLATVSVFIEPIPRQHPALSEAAQQHGAMSVHARRVGDYLVTVVGEVPPALARALATTVEYRPAR